MEILKVKIQGQGYLLNGTMLAPKANGNREYELIKEWLAEGNTPEPEFTEEEIKAKELARKMARTLSPRQARLILLKMELLDDIEALLASDRAMQIWWEYSLDIKRDNEHIIKAAKAFGLTDKQLDLMFEEGAKL